MIGEMMILLESGQVGGVNMNAYYVKSLDEKDD